MVKFQGLELRMSHTKLQNYRGNIEATKGKNPKKSEKSKVGFSDIRIVENTMAPLEIIHAKY